MKRILGALLNFIYNEFVTHLPCHWLRKTYLRSLNKNIHKSVTILMHTRLLNFWDLEIGQNCVINQYVLLDCRQYKIRINDNVDIGPYSRIWTLGHDPDGENHDLMGADVTIQSHVWIASGATILPGVTLAVGSVVASCSVVTKSTLPKSVVAGNPAKFIRERQNPLRYIPRYTPLFD